MSKLLNKNVKYLCDSDDGVMSLYAVNDSQSKGTKPIIFIRGHAGRYTVNTKRILDYAPINDKLIKQHEGFYYDDTIHFPIIAEYSYKDNMQRGLKNYNKAEITTERFANAIVECLEKQDLNNVDIVGASVGANVGMLCSTSDRVDRISIVSPTIPYTYFADIEFLTEKKNKSLLGFIVYCISKIYLDQEYGFVSDMNDSFREVEPLKNRIDSEKIFIDAGAVTQIMGQNIVGRILEYSNVIMARLVEKETGMTSDGAVVTDADYYSQLGVSYCISPDNYHVYCDQKEYILKRAYYNLEKVKKRK